MRPRSLRGWHWRLIHVAVPLFVLGFGFIAGWLLVRLPNSRQDETMPAPAWLLWTGILLCLAALAVWAVALFTAPLYDPEIPSDQLGPPMGPIAVTVLLVGCLCLGLVVSAVVSSESAYRGAPLFFVVLVVVTAAVYARSDRS